MNDLQCALKYWVEFMDIQTRPPLKTFGLHKGIKFIPFVDKSKVIKAYSDYHKCSYKDAEKLVNILNGFYEQNKTMMDNKYKNITISISKTKEFREYFSKYIDLKEIDFIYYF